MTDPITQAFEKTATHFGVPLHTVTRIQIRKARMGGVHALSERKIGSHTEARSRALEAQPHPPVPVIPEGHHIKGVSTLVGNQWIKTARDAESREAMLARLLEDMPRRVPARLGTIPARQHERDSDLLAVYPMGDPHLGMLSWAPETGKDFDLKIAQELTQRAIDQLVVNDPIAETALLLNLGDFFHSDTQNNTTTHGTTVDVDGRMPKILRAGVDLMVYAIDACLRTHSMVHVDCRNGNHDKVTSIFLALALSCYYRNEPRVSVNVSPNPFYYQRFGQCLIGTTHGDMTKANDLQKIMSVDRRQDWGEIEHAFWYCGHVHHTKRVEDYGCTIETFRTLAPADAWHHGKGYRSSRDMNRIILHADYGEIGRSTIGASYLEAQYRKATQWAT